MLLAVLYAPLTWAMTLVAWLLVNWWAPLFAVQGEISDQGIKTIGMRLPNWLAWFDTFDAGLDTGLKQGERANYWTRLCWLYRNPSYGFEYWALGAEFDPSQWTIHECQVDDSIPGKPNVLRFYATGPNGQFNVMGVKWGVRYKLGWKVWNYWHWWESRWSDKPWGPGMRVPFVFSISKA